MGESNQWYESVEKEINLLKGRMTKRDNDAYELDAVLRIAKKILSLSEECDQCIEYKGKIMNAIKGMADWPYTSEEQLKNYILTFRESVDHLGKHRKSQGGFFARLFL